MGSAAAKKKAPTSARPKAGDQADVRCAFVADRPGKHDLGPKPSDSWCHGCEFYICDGCDSPFGPPGIGSHDVTAHDPNEEGC